jgi:hypothetical protein
MRVEGIISKNKKCHIVCIIAPQDEGVEQTYFSWPSIESDMCGWKIHTFASPVLLNTVRVYNVG